MRPEQSYGRAPSNPATPMTNGNMNVPFPCRSRRTEGDVGRY